MRDILQRAGPKTDRRKTAAGEGTLRLLFWDGVIIVLIAAVTGLHYATGAHAHSLHDIYRRLYYFPIIFAAFRHGLGGGVAAGLIVCLVYLPHLLGYVSHDPATTTQKVLEMVLYMVVGLTTGFLASRLRRTRNRLQETAEELRDSLEELRVTEAQLIQTGKLAAVGRLSAGLAHEIRNPLASIKGAAEIVADDYPPDHPKHRLLTVLNDESERLNNVLSRFLAFARPRDLKMEELVIEEEVSTVISLLEGQESEGGVDFVHETGESAPTRLRADREQLRQVLLNVLLNAKEASGGEGTVRISYRRAPESLSVVVQDSGPGFSPEALEDALTPFFTTKPDGSGLGLAISHRIIEAHGGRIHIGNHERGGGIVEIELPRER